ncbi:MAG: hypothetical protein ACWGN7_05995, partial [Thermodesulfovibrionales bacterium]
TVTVELAGLTEPPSAYDLATRLAPLLGDEAQAIVRWDQQAQGTARATDSPPAADPVEVVTGVVDDWLSTLSAEGVELELVDVQVADDRVDCMYLTFRSVELATSANLSDAIERALELRFKGQGKLDRHGKVINYGERFSYGIDMVFSGKWGRNVTAELSPTVSIQGSRGRERVGMISRESAAEAIPRLRSGDLLFFVKDPSRRRVGEIIGHIGIVSVAPDGIFLIHASGEKDGEGSVKKVRLEDYLRTMPFVGLVVTRLDGY